nr:transposase [Thermoanaerobacterium sp. RBIITD]
MTATNGKKIKKVVHEKQVIFYSPEYAAKAKQDRAAVLAKAMDLIKNPGKYNKSISYGAAKYVKNLTFDADTGEISENVHQSLTFDEEKLREEEKFDGYYAIVTSEYKETPEKIIEMYRGLWKIEESFKVTKSDFESRPVYLSLKEHIDAHFLTCFIALVIVRILEHRSKGKYSVTEMLESLSKASCSHVKENYYLFDFYNDVLEDIGKELNIDFSKKFMTLGEIKKILGETKKS